jgi:hypothetical protein
MVAIFGRIIPAPLADAGQGHGACRESWIWREAALGTRVGGHDGLRGLEPAPNSPLWRCRDALPAAPASMRSTGSVSMITPVENGSTAVRRHRGQQLAGQRGAAANGPAASPSAPVPALALPVLISSARMP